MKKRNVVNFIVVATVLMLCMIRISAKNLNIRSAIITSIEYSTGGDRWYTENELKAKHWNITNVYMRVTCDLETIEKLTYNSIDCYMNTQGTEDIKCDGIIDEEGHTIVITTRDAITQNFENGYLRIGTPNNSSSILAGGNLELKLNLIKNWSNAEQKITMNVQYGANYGGPWYDSEVKILDDILETEVLYEVYVKVDASTNAGEMKSLVMTQNNQIVASGVDSFIYKVTGNTTENTKFKIVAESESKLKKEQYIGISNLGEYGLKPREFIEIKVFRGVSVDGPWHERESEVLEDVLEGDTLNKLYIKAVATSSTGNITSITMKQKGKNVTNLLGNVVDSAICELSSNADGDSKLEIEAKSDKNETWKSILVTYVIGSKGEKIRQNMDIKVLYAITDEGPWRETQDEVLNDIQSSQKLSAIYIRAVASTDVGMIRSTTVSKDDNELKSGSDSVIYKVQNNARFSIKAVSYEANEVSIFVDVNSIGKSGIEAKNKITIDLKYALSENSDVWYENQQDMLKDLPENEKLEKVYVKAQASVASGSRINYIDIKNEKKEVIGSNSTGLIIREITGNINYSVTAKSNKGVIDSKSDEISVIGSVGAREDITVTIKYAKSNNEGSTWYNTESELLINQNASYEEYIKIEAKNSKKEIQSIEIKNGDTRLGYSANDNIIHCFKENIDGVTIVVTSTSGKVVTNNISISGVKKNESYITISVRYGITSDGPWRSNEEDILNDVKGTETVSKVYIKAIGEVNIGNITNMQVKYGNSTTEELGSSVICGFSQNTTGGAIYIIAKDNNDNIKEWVGDITKIGVYGVKSSEEDGNDSVLQDIAEEFANIDWNISKNMDWRNDFVTPMELQQKGVDTNVPEIIVSKVEESNVAIISLRTGHDGETGYGIKWRKADRSEDESLSDIDDWDNWQVYSGPFKIEYDPTYGTYIEAKGVCNNVDSMSAIEVINDLSGINSAMYIMDNKDLPLTSVKQYFVAYFGNATNKKYYKKDNQSSEISGNGNMFVIEVDKGSNPTITLQEEVDGLKQDSIEYKVGNAISMSGKETSTNNEKEQGIYKYKVTLEPGSKIKDSTITEVGIIGNYTTPDGVKHGIVRKTNSIMGKNGVFEFEIKNAPSNLTVKSYYINSENRMIME